MNMGEVLDKVSLLGGGEPEYGVVSELSKAARGVFGSCGGGESQDTQYVEKRVDTSMDG